MPNRAEAKFVYLCAGLYVNNGRSDPAFSIVIRIGGAPNADYVLSVDAEVARSKRLRMA